MKLDRPDRRAVAKGENYQDLVSGYVCSLAIRALNHRHVRQLRRGHVRPLDSRDVLALTRWLVLLADAELSDDDNDMAGTDRPMPKRFLLDRDKLMDSMPSRAAWIIRMWDRSKVEGRRRGGLHSAATTGTRKGPPPKFGVRDILPHYHLPRAERKARVIAETGMKSSRYHELLRHVPAMLERIEESRAEAIDPLNGIDPDAFLRGV